MLIQDIERGEGVTLIDPHAPWAEKLLDHDQERTSAEKCYAIAGRAALTTPPRTRASSKSSWVPLTRSSLKSGERKLFGFSGTGKGKLASRTSDATASGSSAIAATTEDEKLLPAAGGLSPS